VRPARSGSTSPPLSLWASLKLDLTVSPQLRVRTWERDEPTPATGAPTAHDAVELTLVEAGTVTYAVARRELVARAGDLVVVPRRTEHATTFREPVRGVALWVGADLVGEIASAMGPEVGALRGGPALVPGANGRVRALLHVLQDEVSEAGLGHARAVEAIAESIIIEVLRRAPRDASGEGARDPRIRAALGYMRETMTEPVSLDALARAARMSRFHFSRLFRDEIGEAPYQHLIRMRVARAGELLRSGHCTVTEAAFSAGFADLSRFARTFRQHTGKRPTEVAREARSAKR
jgi:AraC family transcriptional regulator